MPFQIHITLMFLFLTMYFFSDFVILEIFTKSTSIVPSQYLRREARLMDIGPSHTTRSQNSTLSELNVLSNLHYTYVPQPFPLILFALFIFHISHFTHYTSSVLQGSWWEARLRDTGPPHTNPLSVDLFKIQNPFKYK